jgi:hypothetical protein
MLKKSPPWSPGGITTPGRRRQGRGALGLGRNQGGADHLRRPARLPPGTSCAVQGAREGRISSGLAEDDGWAGVAGGCSWRKHAHGEGSQALRGLALREVAEIAAWPLVGADFRPMRGGTLRAPDDVESGWEGPANGRTRRGQPERTSDRLGKTRREPHQGRRWSSNGSRRAARRSSHGRSPAH